MDAPLALYRRYRPETFAEVIGQDHVTEPLRHALAANKVNHAYLFSGPRGCGKTTSARILARALNCEKAPVAEPCGECQSCRDLARGGPGSIDVIEIDAASHGGVDDARDLRERAFFAPVSSRYKVYIIDEAHMVSPQGFNALLKLVEEPPPHLKFIFATTEPDKVIGTIKSRTHHYPFRLVPPKILGDYLLELCKSEDVKLEPNALPLVVRAGQGSVRDTLSVLDQLLGGAGPEGVTYDIAVQLLGYTPDALLDEAIDAFAASDGATVFGVVDKIIESGQDPRRFAEDFLQRLRDLVIVAAVPDALSTGLLDVPGDRAERLLSQASGFGPSELTRAADIVNAALMEFRGATAPRLLLELMCARILVPGSDNSTQGFQARLDRLERRLSIDGGAAPAPAAPAAAAPAPPIEPAAVVEEVAPVEPVQTPQPEVAVEAALAELEPEPEPTPAAPAPAGSMTIADVRRLWPDVLDKIRELRRFAWVMLSQNAQVMSLDGTTLTIALVNPGARESFLSSGSDEYVQQALHSVLGVTWRIEAIVDPSARPAASSPSTPDPAPEPVKAEAPAAPRASSAAAREAMNEQPSAEDSNPDASADRDDPVIDNEDIDPELLLSRELGAEVIGETTGD
ncbi:DNA polymerase-3 subunit gamma/tau [Aeromicrobium panaciterrae]|uniref:DNA polymerase III subunit gamma/tau n=1 Tax=Aeromicrobium panaciterrae TaxID=363861 RepID=A0ABU1UKG2_9ACTN|nr:DNA polymerase III subunit gamma and tau [Aeromicrobium panaciterrae]MDR7085664.1 DNA polymerase-3 subunit gamma/tau [Aeromicrobium panaciterrae]